MKLEDMSFMDYLEAEYKWKEKGAGMTEEHKRRKKKLTMPQETAEHMDKKVRQKEALNAMISLTKDHTQHIIMDSQRHIEIADKLADQASIYSGYVGTVEEMLNDYSSGF